MGGGETPTPPDFYALVNGQIIPITPNYSEGDGYWMEPEDIADIVQIAAGKAFELYFKLPRETQALNNSRVWDDCKSQRLQDDMWVLTLQVSKEEATGGATFEPTPSWPGTSYFAFQFGEF